MILFLKNVVFRFIFFLQNPTPAPTSSSQNCDYKELITNLHDRISLMVTVDEDLRNRLDTVNKK